MIIYQSSKSSNLFKVDKRFHLLDLDDDCNLTSAEKNNSFVFRFFWEYESCPDYQWPIPSSVTFYGATFRAAYLDTDMALLELNGTPDCRFTFLGWDRSSSGTSKLSCLHHPGGEYMKISIDNNGAEIYPNSKNFGTCFVFPASYSFKFKFHTGTVEKGSSGAPILNQDNRVVGQFSAHNWPHICPEWLAGASFGGRFACSWNYGSTADQRLRDWLDPNNAGAPYVVTRRSGSISGPDNICSSGNYQYTLQNAPSGVTITWTATGNFSPGSGTGSTANVYASASSGGNSRITFNVPHPSKDNFTFSKDVWVGLVSPNSIEIVNPDNYPDNTLTQGEENQLIAMCNGSECNVIQDYEWDYSGWSHYEVGATHNISFVTVPYSFTSKDIKLRAVNQCGAGAWRTQTFYPNQYGFSISPNPSSEYVDICIDEKLFDPEIKDSYEVKIINVESIVLIETNGIKDKLRINIGNLQNGSYYVLLNYNGKQYSKQLIINH